MQQNLSPMKSRKILKILFLISVPLILIAVLFLLDSYYKIKNVTVLSDNKNIKVPAEVFVGKNILLLNEQDIVNDILSRNSQIRRVVIVKKLPDTIELKIEESKSTAKLKVDQGSFYLDDAGKIIKKEKSVISDSIPEISYYQKFSYQGSLPGEGISHNDILTALFFIKKLQSLNFRVDNVDISGLNMIRLNLNEGVLLVTTEKDRNTQYYQLEKIVRQFRIEGKPFKTIDLRFDKPIVQIN